MYYMFAQTSCLHLRGEGNRRLTAVEGEIIKILFEQREKSYLQLATSVWQLATN